MPTIEPMRRTRDRSGILAPAPDRPRPTRWWRLTPLLVLLICVSCGSSKSVEPTSAFEYRVDTRSPRAVLKSLDKLMARSLELTRKSGYTWDNWQELMNHRHHLVRLFDLHGVPEEFREPEAVEVAVLTREALARVKLPALDEVPDEDQMAARVRAGKSSIYRIRGTPLEIGLTVDGPNAGRYQFRRETVHLARAHYDDVKDFPYDPGQTDVEGLYELYFRAPGPAIPAAWIRALPRVFHHEFFGQTVWQWTFLLLSIIVFLVVLLGMRGLIARRSGAWSDLQRRLASLLLAIVAILLVVVIRRFLAEQVVITGSVLRGLLFATRIVMLALTVVIVLALGRVVAEWLVKRRRTLDTMDQHLTRLTVRVVSAIVAVVIIIEGMQRIGFSLATLIAGAGIGGMSIALASQGSLKNLIAGIELSVDKPFAIGQRVRIGAWDGTVEAIGLRSTKLRTRIGHLVIVPNEVVAAAQIDNLGRRPHIRRTFDVDLAHDTPPDKITRALEVVKEILALPESGATSRDEAGAPHPNEAIHATGFLPRVLYSDLGGDRRTLVVNYWHRPPDEWQCRAHAEWINLQILKRFEEEGLELALPTQTVLVDRDETKPGAIIEQPLQ